ncbi:hypothetical protein A6R68_19223, partial [Neotoma lepida]
MHSQTFESLYQKWLDEKARDFSEHCKAFIGGEETEVKKEISKAQDRVIMETVSRRGKTPEPLEKSRQLRDLSLVPSRLPFD